MYIIRQDIQYRLDSNQIHCIDEIFSNIKYIIIDWYHMPWWLILLVYYEYIQDKVIWFSIRDWERKDYIVEDLKFLRDDMWYSDIRVCITDWSPSIISALREVYPNIIHQRCLVHVKRQVKTYISNHPKSDAGKQLKHIMNYRILSDSFLFPIALKVWEITYGSYLKEKSITQKGWWTYKHRNLRRAYKHICNAFPYMFQEDNYKDLNIERTTNKLEWYFWVLTNEWINEHKWLSESRLCSFIALWIYERNYF